MKSFFSFMSSTPTVMLIYACVKAILVPMYTVVFLVNDWTYSHPLIADYIQWHQMEMVFSFFLSTFLAFEFFYSGARSSRQNNLNLILLFNISFILIDNVLWMEELGQKLFVAFHSLFILFFIIVIPKCLTIKQFVLRRLPIKFLFILKIALFQTIILGDTELFGFIMKLSFASLLVYIFGLTIHLKLYKISNKWLQCHFIFSNIFIVFGGSWFLYNLFSTSAVNLAFGGVHFLLALGVTSVVLNLMIRVGLNLSNLPLDLNWKTSFMLISLILGGIIRSVGPELNYDGYFMILHHGMGFWTLAFIFYFFYFLRSLYGSNIKDNEYL